MSASLVLKRPLKLAVRFLERSLPPRIFEVIYKTAFPWYKGLIRAAYLLNGFVFHSWRDRDHWAMVRAVHRVMPFSLVGIGGLESTYRTATEVKRRDVEGDFVELGVAQGGCAALMGGVMFDGSAERVLWLFDSYEGLPEPTADDFDPDRGVGTGDHVRPLDRGSCLGTLEEVRELMLDRSGFPEDRIRFVKGWFHDTIPNDGAAIDKIALLRIDGDWYESTKCCLEGLFPKVAPGGVVIIDDYQSCYGCEKAVTEFLQDRRLDVDIKLDGRGGCYFFV